MSSDQILVLDFIDNVQQRINSRAATSGYFVSNYNLTFSNDNQEANVNETTQYICITSSQRIGWLFFGVGL